MKNIIKLVIPLLFVLIAGSACIKTTAPGNLELASSESALKTMEHVALTANRCWFKSGKADFKSYGLAPELQSYSGRPRILLVPHNNPTGRPVLVVVAEGTPARVSVFGPLMSTSMGNSIADDLDRWVKGSHQC